MPSGAKRRKAAKKKKEKISTLTTNNSSTSSQQQQEQQGNGYSPRSQDEKDSHSDSGDNDTSSPAGSQEHGNPFGRDEGEEKSEAGVGLGEPQSVEIEKSEAGVEEEDDVVTKEVDTESRVVDVEAVKESDMEAVKAFGGPPESEVVEKRREFEPPKKEELSGGKTDVDVVEIDVSVEPIEEVVSVTKELVHEPEKQIVCQPEVVQAVEVVQAGEVNTEGKTGDSSRVELRLNDRDGDVLPPSNGVIVETANDDERPVENQRKDIASVRPAVRPTSWTSCCGLFDVFTGSNR